MKKAVKSVKTVAARAPRKTVKAKPATEIVVAKAPAPKRRGLVVAVFMLLAVGVASQGYMLWKKDQKTKMILTFVNEVAPLGRDQAGAFCCARTMSVDHEGNMYVLEAPEVGHRLQKFSPAGKFLAIYKAAVGKPDQVINDGFDIGSDSANDLYVVEHITGFVKVLSSDLKFKRSFEIPTHSANGLVFNSKDELIIGDREKNQLLVFNTQGQLLRKMDGGENRMGGLFRMAVGPNDSIWVLDLPRGTNNDPDIKGYTAAGELITKWTVKDFPTNIYNNIAYHPRGYIMLNDNRGNSLAKGFYFYTLKGKLAGRAQMTNNRWDFKNISGFAVDAKSGDIFVNTNFMNRGGDRFTWNPDAVGAE